MNVQLVKVFINITVFIILVISAPTIFSKEETYQAVYKPLECRGVNFVNEKAYIATWTFIPTGGSGSEIDIRYNGIKKVGQIRTTVYENGDLYGRGKWIGRTASKTGNTLLTINFNYKSKKFILISLFNPDDFHLEGKCK